MTSFTIKENKLFMKVLLATDMFDTFFLEEAHITTYNNFIIDGHLVADFYSKEEQEEMSMDGRFPPFSKWEQMRPVCFDLIKGKKTPVQFKIILHAPDKVIKQLTALEECSVSEALVRSLVCTIRFDGMHITCVTATSLTTFIPDKSLDKLWDKWMEKFFLQANFLYELTS